MRGRRGSRAIAGLAAGVALLVGMTGVAGAMFSRSTTHPGTTIGTKRMFPATYVLVPSSLRDASGGTAESVANEPLAFAADGRTTTTGAWPTVATTTRWFEVNYPNPLPGGIAVSGATFDLTFSSATNNTTCVWFEVRRRSTGTVVNTHGSSASPVACTGAATSTTSTGLPLLVNTGLANDVRVRLYATNSAGAASVIDRATVTGSTPYGAFTLLPTSATDATTGTPTTTRWSLAATGDSSVYTNVINWKGSYDATRYLRIAYPSVVPSGVTITSARFTHTYRDQDGVSACYWFEVYSGTTLIGTHGSVTVPYCHNGLTYKTDVIDLPEVNTTAVANNLSLKMYVWDGSGNKRTNQDEATISIGYYLN